MFIFQIITSPSRSAIIPISALTVKTLGPGGSGIRVNRLTAPKESIIILQRLEIIRSGLVNNPFIKMAMVTWIIAIILWFMEDRGTKLPIAGLPNYIFYFGALLIAINLFYWLIGLVLGVKQKVGKNRCIRCGSKVAPGMIYCPKHLKEAKNEAIEKKKDGVM